MLQFYRGLKAKYNYPTNTSLQDALFFATDTGELLLNGKNYGIDTEKIKDVSVSGELLQFTMADGTVKEVNIGIDEDTQKAIDALKGLLDEEGKLNISLLYQTTVGDDVTTATTVGSLAKGTKASVLKKLTLSQVFDEMLFPTIQPTATNPSASLALKSYAAVQEVSAAAPTVDNFTASFNQGTITCNGVVQSVRAGAKVDAGSFIYRDDQSVGQQGSANFSKAIAKGDTKYYYHVAYSAGPSDIKDNKGNAATSLTQLPAGSVNSAAVTVTGVYPIYASTTAANITNKTVTKLPLTSAASFEVTMAAEDPDSKQVIKMNGTITKVELFNTVANKYETQTNAFVKTTENIEINGTSVAYNVYTRNQGQNGSSKFRITYTK